MEGFLKGKNMTIKDAEEICRVIAEDYGYTFDIPVMESKRAIQTWGMVTSNLKNGKYVPVKIMFSERLFEEEERFILETIHHEMAHYLSIKRTGVVHQHDHIFKSYAMRLNCPLSASNGKIPDSEKEAKKYRYVIRCKNCKKIVDLKTRRCKVVNHPEYYHCGYCKGELTVEENW